MKTAVTFTFDTAVTVSKIKVGFTGANTQSFTGDVLAGNAVLLEGVLFSAAAAGTVFDLVEPVSVTSLALRGKSAVSNTYSEVGLFAVWASSVTCDCAACASEFPVPPSGCLAGGICNPDSGACEDGGQLPPGSACDDGNLLTWGDRCDAAALCRGEPLHLHEEDARVLVSSATNRSAHVVFASEGDESSWRLTRSPDSSALVVRRGASAVASFAEKGMSLSANKELRVPGPQGSVSAGRVVAGGVDLLAEIARLHAKIDAQADQVPPMPVGTIVSSLLEPDVFATAAGDLPGCDPVTKCIWVPADGRNVEGSEYESITGSATVPDLRGMFLRGTSDGRDDGKQDVESSRSAGSYQHDSFQQHKHNIDPYLNQNTHLLYWHLAGNGHSRTSA